jgi:probable phosphoglycerate mutase
MRLILVRHGQTTSNITHLLDTGAPGADLTDLGRQQSEALPEALRGEVVEAIYASPLARTRQTVAPIAEALGLEVRFREGLREIRAGDLEMLGDDASVDTYLGTSFRWSDGDLDARMPGSESGSEFFARFDAVFAEVAATGVQTALIVTHGAAIRSWTAARTANISTGHVTANSVTNTGAVIVEGSPREGWSGVSWEGRALGSTEVDAPLGPLSRPGAPAPV